jgi:hypothetical protein
LFCCQLNITKPELNKFWLVAERTPRGNEQVITGRKIMNRMSSKETIWFCFGLILGILGLTLFIIPKTLSLHIAEIFILFGALVCLIKSTGTKTNIQQNSHPIVHVYTLSSVTRVMSDIDLELWHQLQERNKLAGIWNQNSRPDSEIKIIFSDSPNNANMYTGTMEQYKKLIRGCQVRKSEMQVNFYPVLDFATAWKFIHGEDSAPPAE